MGLGSRFLTVVAFAAAIGACGQPPAKPALTKDALVGSWRLVSEEARSSSGRTTAQYGPKPTGRLMYDAAGRVSAHLVDPGVKRFVSGDLYVFTPDEVKAAFSGYFGYFGTYTVDTAAGTVTHHVRGASFPNYVGTDQTRFVKLSGDRLELATQPQKEGGEELTTYLVWEREH